MILNIRVLIESLFGHLNRQKTLEKFDLLRGTSESHLFVDVGIPARKKKFVFNLHKNGCETYF